MKAASKRRGAFAALLAAWAWILCAGPTAHAHTGVHARCVQAPKQVKIDGKLDEWGGAEAVKVDHTKASFDKTASDTDAGYRLRTLWDERALYIAAEVTDQSVVADKAGAKLYEADCLEIAIDLDNASEGSYEKDDYQFVLSPSGAKGKPQKWVFRNPERGDREPKYLVIAAERTKTGYVIEAAIPWASLGPFRPRAGAVIGFQHDIRDYDPNEAPAGLCWSPSKDPMANPLEWGDLILVRRAGMPVDKILAELQPGIERFKRLLAGVAAEKDNEVTVDITDKAVSTLSPGIGWNWRYLQGEFPNWTREEWDAFLGMLSWSRPHWVRYGLHMSHWEPANDDGDPDHFEWKGFTFDSDTMKMHYKMLDFCETQGIDVLVCNWKCASWLAETVHDKGLKDTDGKPGNDAPYDPKELVESVAALVHQLKCVRNYRCVKYVSLWNEPNGKWSYNSPNAKYPDTFWAMYPLLDAKLKAMGLRDRIRILGPDSSVGKYADLAGLVPLLDRYGDVIDVLADHDYKGFMDCEKGKRGVPLSEGMKAYADLSNRLRGRKRPIPFAIAEFGNMGGGSGAVVGDDAIFAGSISTAELVTGAAQAGVNGFLRWEYRVYGGSWRNFGALTSQSREHLFCPYPPVYYPHALLSRFIEKGSEVLRVKVSGGRDENGVARVHASAFKWGQNKFSIVLINDGLEPKVVRVSAFPIAFQRFLLSRLSCDAQLPQTIERRPNVTVFGGRFTVGLKPRSINVITTIEKGIDPHDLSLPSRLSPPRLDPSYKTADVNGKRVDTVRIGFEQAGAWSVWQSSDGRTTMRSSEDMPHAGSRSGRIEYDFVSEKKLKAQEHAFLTFRGGLGLTGPPQRLSVWVFGNESGHTLHFSLLDASGETFQLKQDVVLDFAGWRKVELDLRGMPGSCNHWGGDKNGEIDYPIRAVAMSIREKADAFAGRGVVFVDDLEIVAESGKD